MAEPTDGKVPLVVLGISVDPGLLEPSPLRRCRVEECKAACCHAGVYVRLEEVEDILDHHALIEPHLPAERRDPSGWFDEEVVPDEDHPASGEFRSTNLVDGPYPGGSTCVFLRPDYRCALQVAGEARGEHPWRFKPFYCALAPLDFDEGVLILSERHPDDQIEGWCFHNDPEAIPVAPYRLFEKETKHVLGEEGFAALQKLVSGE
jgi:hypothetical protein